MRGVWCRCWGCGLAAVATFLWAGALEAAGRSEAPFESLERQGLESEAAVEQLFQRLDGLLKADGVEAGVRGLYLRHAAFARSGGATFVQAELAQPEPCIEQFTGCETMVGAFLTSTELQDPETLLTLPMGVYGVKKRTAPTRGAVLEFLTPDGGVAHARAVKDGREGLASNGLSVSHGEELRVCGGWSTLAVCWTATVDETADDIVRGVGVVSFNPIEGGCWGIATLGRGRSRSDFYGMPGFPEPGSGPGPEAPQARGEFYEAPRLPEEFKVDGLQVRFTGRVLRDVATICQIALVLELVTIEAQGAGP